VTQRDTAEVVADKGDGLHSDLEGYAFRAVTSHRKLAAASLRG
jgi:hypothetical protein